LKGSSHTFKQMGDKGQSESLEIGQGANSLLLLSTVVL